MVMPPRLTEFFGFVNKMIAPGADQKNGKKFLQLSIE